MGCSTRDNASFAIADPRPMRWVQTRNLATVDNRIPRKPDDSNVTLKPTIDRRNPPKRLEMYS